MIAPAQKTVNLDANTRSAIEHLKATPEGFNLSKYVRISIQQSAVANGWIPVYNNDGSMYTGHGELPELTKDDEVDFI